MFPVENVHAGKVVVLKDLVLSFDKGIGIMHILMPGDIVNIEVYAKYIDDDPQNWTPLLNNLIAAISPSGGIFIDGGQPGSLGNQTPLPHLEPHNEEAGEAPKA